MFSVFFIKGNSFIEHSDGFIQGCFNILNYKHIFASLFAGDGLSQWNWSKGLGAPNKYLPDPFDLIPILLPLKHLELGVTIAVLLKLYCGGLAYLFFARSMKLSNYQCIIGPICYIFITLFLDIMLNQSVFLFTVYMIPLVMLSIDWIYRGKTPLLFIASVAYTLMRDPYMSYMIAIVAILFMLLRYFAYNEKFVLKTYAAFLGKFIAFGIVAALLSAAFSLPYITMVMNASTESSISDTADLFWGLSFVKTYGKLLMSCGYTLGYTHFGIPILSLLVLPIALKKISLKNTPALMSAILIILTFSPLACSMFNGFSYTTGRWFVLPVFFISWATMENLDIKELGKKKNLIIMSICLAVLGVWTIGFGAIDLIHLTKRGALFILINLLAGIALILVMANVPAKFNKKLNTVKFKQVASIFIVCFTLITSWSLNYYLFQDHFIPFGYTKKSLEESSQRVSTLIDDEDFYRTDQVDGVNYHRNMTIPANESFWWQSKSIYLYESLLSNEQFKYNKCLGNNYGYYMRVYTLSNDNRMGLDFLSGVRYFIGNDKKYDPAGASGYAGYGFDLVDEIDGVDIYKNKYDVGLGFAYDKYISEKDFLKLSRLEREQALLQAIVVPDDECSDIDGNVQQVKASNIETSIQNVNYTVSGTEGLAINGNKILVSEDNAQLTLKAEAIHDCQLVLSLDNLRKTEGGSFKIHCSDGEISEEVRTSHSNRGFPNVVDFDMNMGYYDDSDCDLTISFDESGEYSFDDIYLSAMSVENYDKYAQERMQSEFCVKSYSSDYVKGSVDVESDSILYLSIPRQDNWSVYVDGEKVEKISDVNIAFLGVQIPDGKHSVVLKYENKPLLYGICASVFAIILILLYVILKFRRNRRND